MGFRRRICHDPAYKAPPLGPQSLLRLFRNILGGRPEGGGGNAPSGRQFLVRLLARKGSGVFRSKSGQALKNINGIGQLIVLVPQFGRVFRPRTIFFNLTALVFG